jgi:N-acetyl-gamma-glutamyl-phosphate/LysW-gamma-L-alpha-aminoadipyl-6-phosphate reductase
LFLALPHGAAQQQIERFAGLAGRIIDLSADFRLRDPATYARWYGHAHQAPAWLDRFVYGLPEVNRAAIRGAHYVSGVGCNATASLLALLPLAQAGLIDPARPVVVEVKAGSSEGGNSPSLASHHPERAGAVRSFAPTGHRHTGEVSQALGLENVHLSVTSIELVRGVLATAHVWPARHLEPIRKKGGAAFPGCPGGLESPPHDFSDRFLTDKELWQAYRAAYRDEPFVRIVHERGGIYRHPEPKILAGSNYADVGWALDEATGRVVALCAIDNLMKGAAGSAIQCMNLMLGLEETMGLEFPGLHPV